MDNNYVMHFGIKGMRWGVRRYQNKDGTLTPAGKVRYSDVVIKNNQNVNISNSYKNHDVILSKGVHVYRVSDSDENAYKKI